MNWTSVPAMIAIDAGVIGAFAVMSWYAWRLGIFRDDRPLQTGRLLIVGGLSVTATFYVGELLVLVVGPALIGSAKALAILNFMHLEIRWLVSLASVIIIGFGVVIEAHQQRRLESLTSEAESAARASQKSLAESEKRFRALADITPEAVYCFEFDPPVSLSASIDELVSRCLESRLTECNRVFATANGYPSPEQAVGCTVSDLEWARHKKALRALIQSLKKSDFALHDYELQYQGESGEDRILRAALVGEVLDGKLVKVWGSHRDILERHRTRAELAGRLHYQRFVTDMSSRLLRVTSEGGDQGITELLGMAAGHMAADRATIGWLVDTKRAAKLRYVWDRHGRKPWFTISRDDIPWVWPKLLDGEPVVVNSTRSLKITAPTDVEFLSGIGVDGIALVPMMIGEEVTGVIGFSTFSDNRKWSDQDLSDIKVLANLFATAVGKIDAQRELDQSMSELVEAKKQLEAENITLREGTRSDK